MQINRLFAIVYILLEKQTITAAELAERFEVSPRTIYRDVEALSQAGIPIYMSRGNGGGISLLPDFILNKAVLTEDEKSDILNAMKAVSAVSLSKSDAALNKLSSMLGQNTSNWIEVDFSSWGYFGNDAGYFEKIKTAIIEKRIITFLYASGKAETLLREVLPLKLVFKGAAWYLYGFCRMREDYRFFKLRRIHSLDVTDAHFHLEIPEHILNQQKIDTRTSIKAIYRIAAKMAFRVYDEISQYETDENGHFICELVLPDVEAICGYAASYGEYCTILAPEDAVVEMKRRLERTLQNYM